MSYTVDSKTLLFTDLTNQEALCLEAEVTDLVMRGKTVWGTAAFRQWCEAAGYDADNALVVMSASYPQRALLSLLERLR